MKQVDCFFKGYQISEATVSRSHLEYSLRRTFLYRLLMRIKELNCLEKPTELGWLHFPLTTQYSVVGRSTSVGVLVLGVYSSSRPSCIGVRHRNRVQHLACAAKENARRSTFQNTCRPLLFLFDEHWDLGIHVCGGLREEFRLRGTLPR